MKNKISAVIMACMILSLVFTPTTAQSTNDYPIYIIQSGDTLGGIALMFDVTVDELIQVNNIIDPNSLAPGQSLKVPGLPGITGVLQQVTLGLGESFKNLMIKYHLDQNTIVKLNRITNINNLFAGSQFIIAANPDTIDLSPVAVINDESTFLEASVRARSNPQKLLVQNSFKSIFSAFPQDVLFGTLIEGQTPVNAISNAVDSISISPLPLTQGDTVVVSIKTFKPITLSGELNGYKLNFFTEDSITYFALQGIHAMATPGLTDFSISGSDGTKDLFAYHQNILLKSGNFETDDPLTVAPEMIDPAVTVPELERVASITSTFTPTKYWTGMFIGPDSNYGEGMDSTYYRDITSFFGSRRTYNDNPEVTFHAGVDFGGGESLPIVAPAAGKVVFAGMMDIRGNATFIDHGLGVYSAYFHQSKINVKTGDMVEQGQKIGEVGNTGRVDRADEYKGAGAHLHWEMWVNGVQINPLDWLNQEYP